MTSLPAQFARLGRRLLRCMIVLCVILLSGFTAAGTTIVKVWGAPDAALQALRVAQPDTIWLNESADRTAAAPQLHIAWQQEAYQRALALGSRAPMLLLSQQAVPPDHLRAQDAALIWGPPLAQQVQ